MIGSLAHPGSSTRQPESVSVMAVRRLVISVGRDMMPRTAVVSSSRRSRSYAAAKLLADETTGPSLEARSMTSEASSV